MDPRQFQYLAQRLSERGASPVEFRSAISRAYYATYHTGLNQLKDMGFSIAQNAEAHKEVYRHLNNSGDHELVKAASKMITLHTKRVHADYRLNRSDVEKKDNAKMFVQLAEKVIETIEGRCNGQSRNQIINAIQKWKDLVKHAW